MGIWKRDRVSGSCPVGINLFTYKKIFKKNYNLQYEEPVLQ